MHHVPSLGIHHETSGLARQGRVRVKRGCLAEPDRHDIAHDILDGRLPFCCVRSGRKNGWQTGVVRFVPEPSFQLGIDIRCIVSGRLLSSKPALMLSMATAQRLWWSFAL